MMNPKSPTLIGQPKTHKTDIPIRPVVNLKTSLTCKLCKYLNNKIKINSNWYINYSLKNNIDHLVNKIKKNQ